LTILYIILFYKKYLGFEYDIDFFNISNFKVFLIQESSHEFKM